MLNAGLRELLHIQLLLRVPGLRDRSVHENIGNYLGTLVVDFEFRKKLKTREGMSLSFITLIYSKEPLVDKKQSLAHRSKCLDCCAPTAEQHASHFRPLKQQ